MGTLRVAAAQLPCRDDALPIPGAASETVPDAILGDHLDCISRARAAGAQLLLFPELSLTGYAGAVAAWHGGTLPDAAVLRRLSDAAGPMAVAVGLPEEGSTGEVHNAQVVLCAGEVLHRHRKAYLPTYGALEEGKHFTPGRVVEPFRLGAWRIAVLTCADAWNPALPWLAVLAGADLLLVPAASAAGAVAAEFDTAAGWDAVLRHTALVYGLPVAMANYAGGAFWGGSRILGAGGQDMAWAGSAPELLVADLDLAQVRAVRRRLPTRRDAAPELVARELHRRLRAMTEEALRPDLAGTLPRL